MKERKRGEKKGKRDYREWENDEKGERGRISILLTHF